MTSHRMGARIFLVHLFGHNQGLHHRLTASLPEGTTLALLRRQIAWSLFFGRVLEKVGHWPWTSCDMCAMGESIQITCT